MPAPGDELAVTVTLRRPGRAAVRRDDARHPPRRRAAVLGAAQAVGDADRQPHDPGARHPAVPQGAAAAVRAQTTNPTTRSGVNDDHRHCAVPSRSMPAGGPTSPPHPAGRVRAAITARLVKRMLAGIPITVIGPDGRRLGAGGPHDPTLHLHDPAAFHDRLGSQGLIGFGEAYMAGDWSSDDLAGVLTVLAGRMSTLVPAPLQRLRSVAMPRRPRSDANTAIRRPAQHPEALRPVQRPVRHVPRPDDELFVRPVRPRVAGGRPEPAGGAGAQDRSPARRHRGEARRHGPGDRYGMG